MFETLMELPLLKGVSRQWIEKMVGSTPVHFLKYAAGETIFSPGDQCTDIALLISGAVRIVISNPDNRFSVAQSLRGGDVISPEFLFGKHTRYPGSVTAIDTVGLVRLSKADYLRLMKSNDILLYNYLNLLSVSAQKSMEGILAVSTGSLAERIAFWISALTQPRSYDIRLECRQRDLVALFGVPRTAMRQTLEQLHAGGMLDYSTYGIDVLDRPALLSLLVNHAEIV